MTFKFKDLIDWTTIIPIISVVFYLSGYTNFNGWTSILGGCLLIVSVLSAVHHAEVVAHKVGEPFGTIILAICITILEVSLIVSLMVAGGEKAMTYARDTVFAAIMLILNGIIGICIWIGGVKYKEQYLSRSSVSTSLVSLVAILIMTLILPNFTTTVSGPFYSTKQLIFVSVACLVIYSTFLMVQTVRHRSYFISECDADQEEDAPPSNARTLISLFFLIICLGVVVFMAKALSPAIEEIVADFGAPQALVGVIIAAVVLLPEGIAAIRAARSNKIQASLNLALGSALASIGLTIPVVSIVCILYDIPLVLGLDRMSIILLSLSIFTVMLSLSRGKTNILYGTVLLVNMAAYIFYVIYP